MYLHVPAAWLAYLAFGVTALASALWLWPRTRAHGLGPHRRRVGRARRDLHRAHARARLAVGPAGVGRLVGVGRAPRHHRGPLLPLPRLPRAAPHPGRARTRARSAARSPRSSRSSTCRSCTSRSTGGARCTSRARCSTPSSTRKIHGVMAFTLWFGVLAFTLALRVPARPALPPPRARRGRARSARSSRRSPSASRRARRRRRPSSSGSAVDEVRRVRHHRLGAHRRRCSARTGCGSCSARSARSGREASE